MNKLLVTAMAMALSHSVNAKTLTIGIDLSGSNPLLRHENFAYSASTYVAAEISRLKSGDTVQIKTFGARSDAVNLINRRLSISRHNRPEKVAQSAAQFIRSLPGRANTAQSSTNLVAWLEFTDGFACGASGEILVITDAIESSTYVDAKDLLSGKKGLPAPEVDLKGCTLIFYGLGAGHPPRQVKAVRKAWRRWAEQAGVIFKAIIP